jgi:hypothetical protein
MAFFSKLTVAKENIGRSLLSWMIFGKEGIKMMANNLLLC